MIKYIEQWGTGTNDMIAACVNWGLPEPEFELVTGDLVVTIRKDIYTEDYLKNLGLNERQIKAVMDVKGRNEITNAGYRKRFGISDRTALRDLTVICEKGIFQKVGARGRETKYILTRHKPDINPTYQSTNII